MPTAYYFPGSPGNPATPVGGCRYDSSLGLKSNHLLTCFPGLIIASLLTDYHLFMLFI
jgi:hypothetical protein